MKFRKVPTCLLSLAFALPPWCARAAMEVKINTNSTLLSADHDNLSVIPNSETRYVSDDGYFVGNFNSEGFSVEHKRGYDFDPLEARVQYNFIYKSKDNQEHFGTCLVHAATGKVFESTYSAFAYAPDCHSTDGSNVSDSSDTTILSLRTENQTESPTVFHIRQTVPYVGVAGQGLMWLGGISYGLFKFSESNKEIKINNEEIKINNEEIKVQQHDLTFKHFCAKFADKWKMRGEEKRFLNNKDLKNFYNSLKDNTLEELEKKAQALDAEGEKLKNDKKIQSLDPAVYKTDTDNDWVWDDDEESYKKTFAGIEIWSNDLVLIYEILLYHECKKNIVETFKEKLGGFPAFDRFYFDSKFSKDMQFQKTPRYLSHMFDDCKNLYDELKILEKMNSEDLKENLNEIKEKWDEAPKNGSSPYFPKDPGFWKFNGTEGNNGWNQLENKVGDWKKRVSGGVLEVTYQETQIADYYAQFYTKSLGNEIIYAFEQSLKKRDEIADSEKRVEIVGPAIIEPEGDSQDSKVKSREDSKVEFPEDSKVKSRENSEVKSREDSEVKSGENSEVESGENSEVELREQTKKPLFEKFQEKIQEFKQGAQEHFANNKKTYEKISLGIGITGLIFIGSAILAQLFVSMATSLNPILRLKLTTVNKPSPNIPHNASTESPTETPLRISKYVTSQVFGNVIASSGGLTLTTPKGTIQLSNVENPEQNTIDALPARNVRDFTSCAQNSNDIKNAKSTLFVATDNGLSILKVDAAGNIQSISSKTNPVFAGSSVTSVFATEDDEEKICQVMVTTFDHDDFKQHTFVSRGKTPYLTPAATSDDFVEVRTSATDAFHHVLYSLNNDEGVQVAWQPYATAATTKETAPHSVQTLLVGEKVLSMKESLSGHVILQTTKGNYLSTEKGGVVSLNPLLPSFSDPSQVIFVEETPLATKEKTTLKTFQLVAYSKKENEPGLVVFSVPYVDSENTAAWGKEIQFPTETIQNVSHLYPGAFSILSQAENDKKEKVLKQRFETKNSLKKITIRDGDFSPSAQDEHIFLVTEDKKLMKYNFTTGESHPSLAKLDVESIYPLVDSEKLLLVTEQGLKLTTSDAKQAQEIEGLPSNPMSAAHAFLDDKSGREGLVVALKNTKNTAGGVYVIFPKVDDTNKVLGYTTRAIGFDDGNYEITGIQFDPEDGKLVLQDKVNFPSGGLKSLVGLSDVQGEIDFSLQAD